MAIVRKSDAVLIGRVKRFEPLMPRMRWFFPYVKLPEGESPRRYVKEFLKNIGIEARIGQFLCKEKSSENPKIEMMFYEMLYLAGIPKSYEKMDTYLWVKPTQVFKYFTTFLPKKISDYLYDIEKIGILPY